MEQIRRATLDAMQTNEERTHLYDAGGEVDVRGCYTALAVAHMLGLDKTQLAEKSGSAKFIKRCQV